MKVVGKIVAYTIFIYTLLWCFSSAVDYTLQSKQGETHELYRDYPASIYANTIHYAAYGLDKLDSHPRQMFILGASVSGEGFLVDRIMAEFPEYKIHNLSISGSNIGQISQVVSIAEEKVDLKGLDSAVFLVSPHFVSFLENDRKFHGPLTALQTELTRHLLYRIEDGRIIPRIADKQLLAYAKTLLKPVYLIYKSKVLLAKFMDNIKIALIKLYWSKGSSAKADPTDEENRAFRLSQFRNSGYTDIEFDRFAELTGHLRNQGAKVIYIDLPTPTYYRHNFMPYESYRARIEELLERVDIPRISMTTAFDDHTFADDAHPTKEGAELWTTLLIKDLKELISPLN